MAVTDGNGLPLAMGKANASPHEVTRVENMLEQRFLPDLPSRLVGDKAVILYPSWVQVEYKLKELATGPS